MQHLPHCMTSHGGWNSEKLKQATQYFGGWSCHQKLYADWPTSSHHSSAIMQPNSKIRQVETSQPYASDSRGGTKIKLNRSARLVGFQIILRRLVEFQTERPTNHHKWSQQTAAARGAKGRPKNGKSVYHQTNWQPSTVSRPRSKICTLMLLH